MVLQILLIHRQLTSKSKAAQANGYLIYMYNISQLNNPVGFNLIANILIDKSQSQNGQILVQFQSSCFFLVALSLHGLFIYCFDLNVIIFYFFSTFSYFYKMVAMTFAAIILGAYKVIMINKAKVKALTRLIVQLNLYFNEKDKSPN